MHLIKWRSNKKKVQEMITFYLTWLWSVDPILLPSRYISCTWAILFQSSPIPGLHLSANAGQFSIIKCVKAGRWNIFYGKDDSWGQSLIFNFVRAVRWPIPFDRIENCRQSSISGVLRDVRLSDSSFSNNSLKFFTLIN